MVCVASMAAELMACQADPAIDRIIDEPLAATFLDDYRSALGAAGEDPGIAYGWAKRGVRRLVARQAGAVRFGGRPDLLGVAGDDRHPDGPPASSSASRGCASSTELAPLGRSGRADEIAAVIDFLLSDRASFVTGTDVLVDGGVCAVIGQMQ